MSMFDSVLFERAPVVCKCGNFVVDFQTKSLHNALEDYVVTEDDFLMFQDYEIRKDPTEEDPLRIDKINLELQHTAYCGPMEVHTSCDKCDNYWFSINLNLNNGQIDTIKVKTDKLGKKG